MANCVKCGQEAYHHTGDKMDCPPMTPDPIEAVAVALWKNEAERAAPNVAKYRSAETFHEQPENGIAAWMGQARAAIAAMPKVEAGEDDLTAVYMAGRETMRAERDALAADNARMREALRQAGRLLLGVEDAVPVAKAAQRIILAALTPEPDTIGYVDDTGGAR